MRNTTGLHKALILVIAFVSGLGVLLNVIRDDWSLNGLAYFTNMSNLLVFIVYGYLFFKSKSLGKIETMVLYQSVLAIVLTGLVYHLILSPTFDEPITVNILPNILVHTLSPMLVVLERFIYSSPKTLHLRHPFYWLIFPIVYYVFVLIYGAYGGRFGVGTDYESEYPYFFLDINEYGIGYFLLVIILIIAIGFVIVYINRHPNKHKS